MKREFFLLFEDDIILPEKCESYWKMIIGDKTI